MRETDLDCSCVWNKSHQSSNRTSIGLGQPSFTLIPYCIYMCYDHYVNWYFCVHIIVTYTLILLFDLWNLTCHLKQRYFLNILCFIFTSTLVMFCLLYIMVVLCYTLREPSIDSSKKHLKDRKLVYFLALLGLIRVTL